MANCEELKALLELEMIPDIEDAIDDFFEIVADAKNADEAAKAEYAELQELRAALTELLHDIEEGDVSDEECVEIFTELEKMIESPGEDEDV
ncbi:hypothetical protein [Hydrogenimonas urashimensis]|uniref:hypothetical protein n=1 Tax=Hydrogenimonas urashimensis TaxID=2740515 RepID=UPI001916AD21|nr:hypothetical protein [Hydrogenimonas urashimensis]